MERTQADAAAEAILAPLRSAQEARREEIRARRESERLVLARRRRVAWLALAGSTVGAIAACFAPFHFSQGIIWGGFVGATLGSLITRHWR